MHYVLALMFYDGHAEAQVIDPVTGCCWLGIDFHGTLPRTPEHFDAQGAMLMPITRQSATALRDMMDQLKLVSGTAQSSRQEVDGVVAELEHLQRHYPAQSLALHSVAQMCNEAIEKANADAHLTLFDFALGVPDRLRALADTVRGSSPELASALVDGDDSLLGRYHIVATPYYFVDGKDAQGCRMKYERKGKQVQDFVGRDMEVFGHPRTFQRPADAMPLIGTNCLNFVLRAGRDVAGIPFSSVSPALCDTHNVMTLEGVVEEKLQHCQPEAHGALDVGMERLANGTPVAYINAVGISARFPDCLKELSYGDKPLLKQLATTRHPLYDRSLSHATMRA